MRRVGVSIITKACCTNIGLQTLYENVRTENEYSYGRRIGRVGNMFGPRDHRISHRQTFIYGGQ